MKTISADEFKKTYGSSAVATPQKDPFNPFPTNPDAPTYGSGVADAFKGGIARIGEGIQEAKPSGGGGVAGLATGVGKILGGAAGALFSPIAPVVNATLGKGINAAGEALSETPYMKGYGKDLATQAPDQNNTPEKILGGIQDYSTAAGTVAGFTSGPKAAPKVGAIPKEVPPVEVPPVEPPGATIPKPRAPELQALDTGMGYVKGAIKDVTPSAQGLINHNIAKALDLTPGDLINIEKSTGNDFGRWMADNNLIGKNKPTTEANIKNFFKTNYEAVRAEIGKVTQIYKPYQVPRYIDSLKQIYQKTQGTPGLEKVNVEIDNLLHKQDITLADVQRVKELMDEHFNLYKVTGDVAEGVSKEGLANIRTDLKNFIEQQVKEQTGADIRQMNNNVQTARSAADAITTRSTRGLTRANITWRDVMTGLGLSYFATPLIGIPAIFARKLLTSPTVRLRFARFIDQLSDAQKARIVKQLTEGTMPPEVEAAIQEP